LCIQIAGVLVLKGVAEDNGAQTGTQTSYGSRFAEARSTFGARVAIWETGVQILKDRPLGLLIGELHGNAVERMSLIAGKKEHHLHNSYLETLVIGGVPALLLAVAVSVLLIIYGLRLMVDEKAPLASKMLVLPLVGLFIHSVLENYIFTFNELPNLPFFLCAGVVVYEARAGRGAKA